MSPKNRSAHSFLPHTRGPQHTTSERSVRTGRARSWLGATVLLGVLFSGGCAQGDRAAGERSGSDDDAIASLVRTPYLQSLSADSVTIVWRTEGNPSIPPTVYFGTDVSQLDKVAEGTSFPTASNGMTTPDGNDCVIHPGETDHVVTLTELSANTQYYFRVDVTGPGNPGNPEQHFTTASSSAIPKRFSAWVLGDSGTGAPGQARVRDGMLSYVAQTGADAPDMLLHLGDIAYSDGTDDEFTHNHFGVYQDILQRTVVWPALGNHEGRCVSPSDMTGPYFDAHVLPIGGEAGGMGSGTEAYYSFDYENVHFVSLDSTHSVWASDQAMLDWLVADLESSSKQWTIAFFHHAPFTRGSHNADCLGDTDKLQSESGMLEMRELVLPILESSGVDLVLAGHSHVYERSFLVDGVHESTSGKDCVPPSLEQLRAENHIVDEGDGNPASAYRKLGNDRGTVYVVAGHGASVGKDDGMDHPIMATTQYGRGSGWLEIDGDQLTYRNLDDTGDVTDEFVIDKTPGFVAYNDLAYGSGQTANAYVTKYTASGAPTLSKGNLLDFASGADTGIELEIVGGLYDENVHAHASAAPAPSTDAYAHFQERLDALGSISYVDKRPALGGNLELVFRNLDPAKRYEVVFYGNRGEYGWDRASLVTLEGADEFVNASSFATDNPAREDGAIFAGPTDPSTRLPADNPHGYVARFVDVIPNADTTFSLVIRANGTSLSNYRGKYANAVKLVELGEASRTPAVAEFDAYNDLAWLPNQTSRSITRYTSPDGGSGLLSHGTMVDFATGAPTGITMTVEGGVYDADAHGSVNSAGPAPETPAFEIFANKLDALGSIAYSAISPPASDEPLRLTFENLDPTRRYEVVLFGDRGAYGATRASRVTLVGAESFTNTSSNSGAEVSGPNGEYTRLLSQNPEGHVARYTDIAAGADHSIELTVAWDGDVGEEYRGKYANAIRLRTVPAP